VQGIKCNVAHKINESLRGRGGKDGQYEPESKFHQNNIRSTAKEGHTVELRFEHSVYPEVDKREV
jgi:hypothetical protein